MAQHPYIAQTVFQCKTGLAKDRFVNTWHFLGGDVSWREDILGIAHRLTGFWCDQVLTGSFMSQFLSNVIQSQVSINIYRFEEAPPRKPYVAKFTFSSTPIGRLPEEIALCMSFTSGRNVPRGRGRIYLGPLGTEAVSSGAEVTSRPAQHFLDDIAGQATKLIAEDVNLTVHHPQLNVVMVPGIDLFGDIPLADPPVDILLAPATSHGAVTWAQYSHVGLGTAPTKKNPGTPNNPIPVFRKVTDGWIDNEWDGQNRRRVDSSARVLF